MIKIAVDAMGGDYAPDEIVKGAVAAAKDLNICILLIGDQLLLAAELTKFPNTDRVTIIHASQSIAMDESPAIAVKSKKDSSINVGLKAVRDSLADGFVSAGNTGAVMASAIFTLGRIKGIERPAIAMVWPTKKGKSVLLDFGANADCKPIHLLQFAQLGSVFAEKVLNISNPKVGLLSIGEEDSKGNELVSDTLPLLRKSKLNFVGNVESKEIFNGDVDVFVCDGFVGNMLLKFAEGMISFVYSIFKKEIKNRLLAKFGALLLLPVFKAIQKKMNYDEYGGALLLGVNGVCIISHGRSNAKAISNAIKVAKEAVEAKIINNFGEIT